jgi:hypothetical protein
MCNQQEIEREREEKSAVKICRCSGKAADLPAGNDTEPEQFY